MEKNIELIQACRNGYLAEAQTLVHVHGARVNAIDPDTWLTPMHVLCAEGHLSLLRWLLEWTTLMATVSSSSSSAGNVDYDDDAPLIAQPSVLQLLQAVDNTGNTPLHYACTNGNINIIRVLATAVVKTSASDITTEASTWDSATLKTATACWTDLLAIRNTIGYTPAEWARAKLKTHIAVELESPMILKE